MGSRAVGWRRLAQLIWRVIAKVMDLATDLFFGLLGSSSVETAPKVTKAEVRQMETSLKELESLEANHQRGWISDTEYETRKAELLSAMGLTDTREPPWWSELGAWLLLAVLLLAVYLAWVLGTAWIVLQVVAPEGVPTLAWIATIACAAVVGYGGSLLWERLGGASRYTPLWWVVAPVVIEVVAFSVVNFAS